MPQVSQCLTEAHERLPLFQCEQPLLNVRLRRISGSPQAIPKGGIWEAICERSRSDAGLFPLVDIGYSAADRVPLIGGRHPELYRGYGPGEVAI